MNWTATRYEWQSGPELISAPKSLQVSASAAVVPAMKPHVRRGRAAKEKRIQRAKARLAAPKKQAA
ncbi:MAG TPA: hypothetical protein VG413_05120 [Candidatus Dormibacteraeota bacterium]|nr:hypothetical protein [Candidatus Dormibacteraeota bacterium]